MTPQHHLPADIERTSLSIITAELEALGLTPPPETAAVVKRVIHTTADFDYARNLRFTPGAVAAGVAALPRPRRFALTFSLMAAMIPPSRDESGNSLRSRGASRRVSALTAPLRSSSSITALHRQTAPKSSKVKLTAAEAPPIRRFRLLRAKRRKARKMSKAVMQLLRSS